MGDKQRIGVRYCGGCNPRYDRVAVVNKLASLLPQAELVPAQAGAAYAGALVVCGCPSRCAGGDGLAVPPGRQVPLLPKSRIDCKVLINLSLSLW